MNPDQKPRKSFRAGPFETLGDAELHAALNESPEYKATITLKNNGTYMVYFRRVVKAEKPTS